MKRKCIHVTPIYYGTRGAATAGQESKDCLYRCYLNYDIQTQAGYSQANTIAELCKGCKKYDGGEWVKEINDKIREKLFGGMADDEQQRVHR